MMTKWQKQIAVHKGPVLDLIIMLYRLGVFEGVGQQAQHEFGEKLLAQVWRYHAQWENLRFKDHAVRERTDRNIYSIPKKNIKPTKTRI